MPRPRRPAPEPGAADASRDLVTCPLERLRGAGQVVDGVALVLDGGRVHAFAARCPHGGASLLDGALSAGVVTCPRHGARYRLRDGRALAGPVRTPARVFAVDVRDGVVHVSPDLPVRRPALSRLLDTLKEGRRGRTAGR